jgi:hypothetical protein
MYFSTMPNIYYDFPDKNGNPSLKIIKDITTNVRFLTRDLENYTMYDYYDILDDETPEIISTKVYGSPKYHWIIMILNGMYDYRSDFPLNYNTLLQYVRDKYGAGNEYHTHHYEAAVDATTNSGAATNHVVMPSFSGASPVSNFDYEDRMNETKRRIKLVSKDVIDSIVKQYTTSFS